MTRPIWADVAALSAQMGRGVRASPDSPHAPVSQAILTQISVLLACFGGAAFALPAVFYQHRFNNTPLKLMLAQFTVIVTAALSIQTTSGHLVILQWSACVLISWVLSPQVARQVAASIYPLITAVAIIQFALGLPAISRVGSFLQNPNNLGAAMLPAVALAYQRKQWRWLIVFIVVLLLTGSRAAWLGLLAGAAVILAVVKPRALLLIPLAGGAGFVWAAITPGHAGMDFRLDLWQAGIRAFLDKPLTGIGLGNYQQAFISYAQLTHERVHMHSHNIFIQVLSEQGVLGFSALIVLLVVIGVMLYQWYQASGVEAAPAVALFVGILTAGMLDYVYWLPANLLLLMISSMALCHNSAGQLRACRVIVSQRLQQDHRLPGGL